MGAQVRVYICTGCTIGETLDVAGLRAVAASEFGAPATEHPHLCSPQGVELLRVDREAEGFDRVAIAACSPRANAEVFTLDSAIVERVNLREQVAWSHAPNDEDTQAMAEDQLRVGIISRGIDGVLLLGCKFGEDYQCHFITGSELANRRMDNVRETLSRLRVEPERVKLVQVAMSDYDKLPQIVNDFAAELRKIGPNPYKGF